MNSWICFLKDWAADLFSIFHEIENLFELLLFVFLFLFSLFCFPFAFLFSVIHDFLVFPLFRKDDV